MTVNIGIEKVNKFKNKGVVLSINVHSVYDRIVVLGTVEYGIKYFSKYAFANHHSLYLLYSFFYSIE